MRAVAAPQSRVGKSKEMKQEQGAARNVWRLRVTADPRRRWGTVRTVAATTGSRRRLVATGPGLGEPNGAS
jgi:hypothetical protein